MAVPQARGMTKNPGPLLHLFGAAVPGKGQTKNFKQVRPRVFWRGPCAGPNKKCVAHRFTLWPEERGPERPSKFMRLVLQGADHVRSQLRVFEQGKTSNVRTLH